MSAPKLLLLLPLSSLLCLAQDAIFSTDVRVVSLFATVRDARGRVVNNLTKSDFTLEEDGKPQLIRYFAQESGLPLTLGILVDTSVSQERLLGEERSASLTFLSKVLRPEKDRAFIIHFDSQVELLQDLTSSRELLGSALARLQTPDKRPKQRRAGPNIGKWALAGTDLYDSILLASEDLMRNQSGRKALIVLTDGVDNGSRIGLTRAIESAQRADTMIFSILFSDRHAYDGVYAAINGKKVLQRVSQETGGALYEVSEDQPISAIYAELEEELRNQYSIGYTPENIDKLGYRKINLATKGTGFLVVTRDGYYSGR